jgi:peroxiredoxin Q/BCP
MAVRIGEAAPAFELPDQDGNVVTNEDLEGQWVVLYFYPKDDTPGCTTEACEFTEGMDAFESLNATVIGVSPDAPERHRRFIEKHDLGLRLLSDPEHRALEAFDAWGVKVRNGKEVEGVIRSTVLLAPDGTVGHHWSPVTAKGHADEVRERLESLQG